MSDWPASVPRPHVQARRVLATLIRFGTSRHAEKVRQGIRGSQTTGFYHSVGTFDAHVQTLGRALKRAHEIDDGIYRLADFSFELAEAVQEELQLLGKSEATLNRFADAWNMSRLALRRDGPQLGHLSALARSRDGSRAYSPRDVEYVRLYWVSLGRTRAKRVLSLDIIVEAGLRVTELFTIRRFDEQPPSSHRDWDPARWAGKEDWVPYTVKGKGGLVREIRLHPETAQRLEAVRLPSPKHVVDRKINYEMHYDLEGGLQFTNNWKYAADREIGESEGAHGLRHGFAVLQFCRYIGMGMTRDRARLLLSQVLGHFRADIVDCYLRFFDRRRKTV